MFSPSLLCSHKEVSDCDPVAMLNTYLAKSLNLLQLIYHINHFGRKIFTICYCLKLDFDLKQIEIV